MKKLMIVIFAMGIAGMLTASNSGTQTNNTNTNFEIEIQVLPYGVSNYVPMVAIANNNEYTVYRVDSDFVSTVPSCKPVGEKYNYFVYKNGQFHLTVNQCNKDKVFKYFQN